jgi:hypothetical protein
LEQERFVILFLCIILAGGWLHHDCATARMRTSHV